MQEGCSYHGGSDLHGEGSFLEQGDKNDNWPVCRYYKRKVATCHLIGTWPLEVTPLLELPTSEAYQFQTYLQLVAIHKVHFLHLEDLGLVD